MNKKDHKLYSTWKNMMARCYVKSNPNYKRYGARGITVEESWHDFRRFVEDVDNHLPKGYLLYRKEYQLDKDINGGAIYSLENCVVITGKKNRAISNEKVKRKIIATYENEEIRFDSISKAGQKLGINRSNIQACLKHGWQNKSGYRFKYCDEIS